VFTFANQLFSVVRGCVLGSSTTRQRKRANLIWKKYGQKLQLKMK